MRFSPLRAFLKMYRPADVPVRRNSLLFPFSYVTGGGLHPFFLPAKEGDRGEKNCLGVAFGGGSSSPCQRGPGRQQRGLPGLLLRRLRLGWCRHAYDGPEQTVVQRRPLVGCALRPLLRGVSHLPLGVGVSLLERHRYPRRRAQLLQSRRSLGRQPPLRRQRRT